MSYRGDTDLKNKGSVVRKVLTKQIVSTKPLWKWMTMSLIFDYNCMLFISEINYRETAYWLIKQVKVYVGQKKKAAKQNLILKLVNLYTILKLERLGNI